MKRQRNNTEKEKPSFTNEVAVAIGSRIEPHVPRIIDLVHQSLVHGPNKGVNRSKRKEAQEALRCVTKLATAVGPGLAPHVGTLVDDMFLAGLSQTLLEALDQLATHIPSLLASMAGATA